MTSIFDKYGRVKRMRNYWEQTENKDDLERGMFIILPLRYEETAGFSNVSIVIIRILHP